MKKNKIVIIASVVGISLLSFVGCGSSKDDTTNNGVEQSVDDTATDNEKGIELSEEEAEKYKQVSTLYDEGYKKEQDGDLEGALTDYEEALMLIDEILQINQIEEFDAFKIELETRIENIKSGNNEEINSETEESSVAE